MSRPAGEALATLVVTPRERFTIAAETLEKLLAITTDTPHELVYVDGGSPPVVRRRIARLQREHGFELVRTEGFLTPNRARNLGFARVHTRYTVFVDNDVFVTPGWLAALVRCAEETGASIVTPLVCQGRPLHTIVHLAGGVAAVEERRMIEHIHAQGRRAEDVLGEVRRAETGLAEFHCMLARTDALASVGAMDERISSTKEHVDLCIRVRAAGGSIWLEPSSVVTYCFGPPVSLADHLYYMLRWSDDWERRSLERLREKYDLADDDAYLRRRYRNVGWRRRQFVIRPWVRRWTRGRGARRLEGLLGRLDARLNEALTKRYARRSRERARTA